MANACIEADWGEPAEIQREELRRAGKRHTCGECGDAIEPGDLHEYVTGKWEGEWATFRTCARCVNIRRDYFHSWVYTCMVVDFRETHGFDYRDGIPADFAPCKDLP